MSQKVATPAMTRLLTQRHEENPEATLRDAKLRLEEQSEAANGEAAVHREQLLVEIDELIASDGEDCSLGDFVPPDSSRAVGGPNVHG